MALNEARRLTELDVRQRLRMPEVIDAVEEAFRQLAAGSVDNVPRRRAKAPGMVLHSMSATLSYLGLAGWKQYTTSRKGNFFLVGLHALETGRLLALIEADYLGQQRTGAVTGVAARYLARADADRAGLLGAGWQARSQLEALAAVRPLREVCVYSRTPQQRERFAAEMGEALQVSVRAVDDPRAAVTGQPIVVTATSSTQPVLRGEWLEPGTFVAAIGSNWLHKSELDAQAVARADRVVCDSIRCCQEEAGDFVEPARSGDFAWAQAEELADIVAGRAAVSHDEQRIILFKSVGMAMEDVATANLLMSD